MQLRLANFDGPLDLLLHLIKSREMNIFDIPIFEVTEQFLSYLKYVPRLDFTVAGEYLAIASQLIEIKSQMLIPALQNRLEHVAENLDEIDDGDPRKPLVEQLLEYESYRKASEFLVQKLTLYKEIYPSRECKRREEEFAKYPAPIVGHRFDLVIAFERVLLKYDNQKKMPKVAVNKQKITIQERMSFLQNLMLRKNLLSSDDLFVECATRYELIVTFMAVLELTKMHFLFIFQEEHFTTIYISKGSAFHEGSLSKEELESAL